MPHLRSFVPCSKVGIFPSTHPWTSVCCWQSLVLVCCAIGLRHRSAFLCSFLQRLYLSSYPGDFGGGYKSLATNILGQYPNLAQNRPLVDAIVSFHIFSVPQMRNRNASCNVLGLHSCFNSKCVWSRHVHSRWCIFILQSTCTVRVLVQVLISFIILYGNFQKKIYVILILCHFIIG